MGFLAEETGELARAVRAIEIGRDRPDETERAESERRRELTEELGDVLGNIILLANHYNLTLEEVMEVHKEKLLQRFQAD
jgi:NTP pyrophosphatase (non-canonical NTP hydrolase)